MELEKTYQIISLDVFCSASFALEGDAVKFCIW
jgi:hypothetical protein